MTARTVIVALTVDDEKAADYDCGTLDYVEREMGWLEPSNITLDCAFVADADDADEWQRYLNYLAEWVFTHIGEEFSGMSPVCFNEWRDNEEQEVD